MSDSRLPTGWSELFQSLKPFGETDLAEVLTALGMLLDVDGSSIKDGDSVLARVGGSRGDQAMDIALEHCGATLHLVSSRRIPTEQLSELRTFAAVLDLALLSTDRREDVAPSPMISPIGGRDRLTNTIDRDSFADYLNIEFAAGPISASIIVLGLDGMGVVNDTLGHTAGDVVLAEVADRLRATLRACDIVSRLGGDVFGIYCPNMSVDIATGLTRRLQSAVNEPITLGVNELRVTATAGIASRARAEKASATLSHGDLALQSAKAHGVGQLAVYDGELQMRIEDRRNLATEFVDALAQNQLSTSMEPIVHLPGGSVVGVEARVVWNHPERGIIDRSQFIHLAELIGRVSDVERAVLEFALLSQGATERTRTGVSLSGSTLRDPLAIGWVLERLQDSDGQVIIDVSEDAVHSGGGLATKHLAQLRAAGASVVLEDFGMSLASLRTLHAFTFDGVKLHQSLIGEGDTRRGAAIIKAVYASAAVVGFDVVHTGIDTDEDLSLLLSMAGSALANSVFAQGAAVRARVAAGVS